MLTIDDVFTNDTLRHFSNFGLAETPIYAKYGDLLFEIGEISQTQIKTPDGPHDVIVLAVSEKVAPEA